MRWLSSFAILFYLSLLCTPQELFVHDPRLSPLADTQFHAVNPSLHQHTLNTPQDKDDDPQLAVIPVKRSVVFSASSVIPAVLSVLHSSVFLTPQQARAPPLFS
ncbi:hypothetical protein M2404_002863 [Rheinheimera pacifica]|uniref:hypothetical protein n=1 Tax=Rheinheimera pacifica TaxID=173990 RepID=UPI00216A8A7A|nr:hypothetical protein [Rheinheimera pacifica]MCS4308506.1 hypothetical protein [Rheinheimera pacifica]